MAHSGALAPKAVLRLLGRKETQGERSLSSPTLATSLLLIVALLVVLISHLGL